MYSPDRPARVGEVAAKTRFRAAFSGEIPPIPINTRIPSANPPPLLSPNRLRTNPGCTAKNASSVGRWRRAKARVIRMSASFERLYTENPRYSVDSRSSNRR